MQRRCNSRVLDVSDELERDMVAGVLPYLVQHMGKEATADLLNEVDRIGGRFIDLIHAVEREGRCGTADPMPEMDFTNKQ